MSDGALFRDLMAYYDPDKQPIQEFRIIHSLVEDPNNFSPTTPSNRSWALPTTT